MDNPVAPQATRPRKRRLAEIDTLLSSNKIRKLEDDPLKVSLWLDHFSSRSPQDSSIERPKSAPAERLPGQQRSRSHFWATGLEAMAGQKAPSGANAKSEATKSSGQAKSVSDGRSDAISSSPSKKTAESGASKVSGSATTSKTATAQSTYIDVLRLNGVVIHNTPTLLPEKLRTFLNETILKKREDVLSVHDKELVVYIADKNLRARETTVSLLLDSPMFGLDTFRLGRNGLKRDGEAHWHTKFLPDDPSYPLTLSQPHPDWVVAYSNGEDESKWTRHEDKVLNHPAVLSSSQASVTGVYAFLVIELKAESSGHLCVAENQAAGSGSTTVNALRWLLNESRHLNASNDGSSEASDEVPKDANETITFSITMNQRQVHLFVNWYDENKGRFTMSCIKSFWTMEQDDVERCRHTVSNIIDWALDIRLKTIKTALKSLYPFPSSLKQPRKHGLLNASTENDESSCKRPRTGTGTNDRSLIEENCDSSKQEQTADENTTFSDDGNVPAKSEDLKSGSSEIREEATAISKAPSIQDSRGQLCTKPGQDGSVEGEPRKRHVNSASSQLPNTEHRSEKGSRPPKANLAKGTDLRSVHETPNTSTSYGSFQGKPKTQSTGLSSKVCDPLRSSHASVYQSKKARSCHLRPRTSEETNHLMSRSMTHKSKEQINDRSSHNATDPSARKKANGRKEGFEARQQRDEWMSKGSVVGAR